MQGKFVTLPMALGLRMHAMQDTNLLTLAYTFNAQLLSILSQWAGTDVTIIMKIIVLNGEPARARCMWSKAELARQTDFERLSCTDVLKL